MRAETEKYCLSCGKVMDSKLELCPHCGVRQPDAIPTREFNTRWLAAMLLSWLLGIFGAHRFFLGRTGSGIAMILTLGGLGVWYLVDLILMLTANFKDSEGKLVKYYVE